MTSFNDIESDNFEAEEMPKSTLFTIKKIAMAMGIFAALGLVTAGSLYLLGNSSSSLSPPTNMFQRNNLVFDDISSSTPYWIPFFVDHFPYGIIPKPADNTCTLLYSNLPSTAADAVPKLSKDREYIYFYGNDEDGTLCLDVDTKAIVPERTVGHYDKYFALTQDKFISAVTVIQDRNVVSKIRLSSLDPIGTNPLSFTDYESRCVSFEQPIVLASTNDASKIFYACVIKEFNFNATRIFLKDFTTDATAETDIPISEKSYIPDWFLISPDNQYTVHIGFDGHHKIIEIGNAQTGVYVLFKFLPSDFEYSSIKNVTFSDDGKSIHIINVKDSPAGKETTIRAIDFEKLLRREADFAGEALPIEFPRG